MKLSMNEVRPCPCGSGKDSRWHNDARGIPFCRTCDNCHETKMSGYRAEVLTDSNYEADEEIGDDGPNFV
jgi:hypothetical protein